MAIIGAGAYGLATAAHLGAAGVPVRAFGEAMSFWRWNMPQGCWRSRFRSSHTSHVGRSLTIDAFEADQGRARGPPAVPHAL